MEHFAEYTSPDEFYATHRLKFRPGIYSARDAAHPPIQMTAKEAIDRIHRDWGSTRLCEGIHASDTVKPFFDFDLKRRNIPEPEELQRILDRDVIHPILRVIKCDESAIAVASSHGWLDETMTVYKVSFRAFVQGYSVRVRDMRKLVGPEQIMGPPFDPSVYPVNGERVLRCVGAVKGLDPKTGRTDNRVLIPLDSTRPYTDYLVQFVDEMDVGVVPLMLLGGEDEISPRPM